MDPMYTGNRLWYYNTWRHHVATLGFPDENIKNGRNRMAGSTGVCNQ